VTAKAAPLQAGGPIQHAGATNRFEDEDDDEDENDCCRELTHAGTPKRRHAYTQSASLHRRHQRNRVAWLHDIIPLNVLNTGRD
jgi:hypothetical protein